MPRRVIPHVPRDANIAGPSTVARAGWEEAAEGLAEAQAGILDEGTPTRFDGEEWAW